MEADDSAASNSTLKFKLTRVKKEGEAENDVQVKVEDGVHNAPPPPPMPVTASTHAASTSSRPTFTVAPAPVPVAPPAKPTSTPPIVYNQQTMRQRLKRRPKSILDYLCSLDKSVLDVLYQDTFTCLTIFRSLHPLAKQYLLRLLTITDSIPLGVINSWVLATPTSQQAHKQAMNTLWELQLLIRTTEVKDVTDTLVIFNPAFQTCLQNALSNRLSGSGDLESASDDPDRPELSVLEEYAQEKWDAILHWMVGASSKTTNPPSDEVTARLVGMGLMEPLNNGARATKPRITPSGFAFLFKDIQTQVWDVILAYMDDLDRLKLDRDQVLQFLFRLSFLKLGMGYPTGSLTATQRRVLTDLTAFGLIYMKNSKGQRGMPKYYYPTRLALNLSSVNNTPNASTTAAAAAAGSTSTGSNLPVAGQGYIILETTFRLYAFTTSPFHTALLGLFCRLDIALPNLLVGTITKESVRHALKNNISSTEIITYLESYAKDDMKVNTPVLPENVVDQIRLWEQERNRMSLTESYLFEFDSNDTDQVIQLVLTEAFKQPDQILLHHAQKKLIVVTPDGYTRLKAYKLALNKQMEKAAQQIATGTKQV